MKVIEWLVPSTLLGIALANLISAMYYLHTCSGPYFSRLALGSVLLGFYFVGRRLEK